MNGYLMAAIHGQHVLRSLIISLFMVIFEFSSLKTYIYVMYVKYKI